jgi:prepilin-type processing-associated H-X9-DG protein
MPKQYLLPGINIKQEFPSTHYQVLVGNSAMFELRKGVSFARITDGLSNTFMVVEADTAVPWSKPDDLAYDPKQAPKLGYHYRSSCNALFGDGSVRSVKKTTKPEILHLYIQRDDGQVVPNLP